MIIHTPEITNEAGMVYISARFELETAKADVPDRLWFRFPESYCHCSTGRADGFAAALLLLAMLYGEDMEIHGVLSPRLLHGMKEYQRIFTSWLPHRLKIANIYATNCAAPQCPDIRTNVGCAFSGGVDSFYTLWSHLPDNEPQPEYQLTHALFLHGYDIFLEDTTTYRLAAQSYLELMRSVGIELITAQTNIYEIVTPTVGWEWAHGSALIGSALTLDRLFTRFYVPSTHTYGDLFPWGSDPRIDHFLATECIEVIHDAASVTRTEKIAAIAHWPATYPRLRVCWEKPDGLRNCCRCSKCIRTMTTLDVLGVLSRYSTFPLPLTRHAIRSCHFADENERDFGRQVRGYALAKGRKDIAWDLGMALVRSHPWAQQGRGAARAALQVVKRQGRRVLERARPALRHL